MFKYSLKPESSTESLFWITVAAIGAIVGIDALINKIKNIKEQKNPTLIIDRYFKSVNYNNTTFDHPLSIDKDHPIVIDNRLLDEYIVGLSDSDGWYSPSKSKWVPCQSLTYWIKHYAAVVKFVAAFKSIATSKQIDKDTQKLSDFIFGEGAFLGSKSRFASGTTRFRWAYTIIDKKNGWTTGSLLGFPNEWSVDKDYRKCRAVNALRQRVVEICKSLREPIENALKSEGKSEEQLNTDLGFLRLSIVVLDSIYHDLKTFTYDISNYKYAIDSVTKK